MTNASNGGPIWCVAETRHGKLAPTLFELLTAARALSSQRGGSVVAVVAGGPGVSALAAEAASRGADKVLVAEHGSLAEFVDDAYAGALLALAAKEKPETILVPASVFGRSLAPRLAVGLRTGLAAEVLSLALDAEKRLVATRSSYAGNVLATVVLKRKPELVTVRPLAFEPAAAGAGKAEIVKAELDASACRSAAEYRGFSPDTSGEIDLAAAEKIVSGGRGLGKPEGFELVRQLAKTLGAAVGASRATVDSGWIPYKHQVGLTGRAVRPRLYVACGISGQIQHLAGMKSSDVIVAINTDPECPMMKLATYAVQGDLYQVLPALIAEIRRARGLNGSA